MTQVPSSAPARRQVLFVTRHSGARDWVRAHATDLAGTAEFLDHLPPGRIATLQPGDVVIGALPVHLVAEVNARGARYLHLALDLPPEARGQANLGAAEMERYGARLVPYTVVASSPAPPPAAGAPPRRGKAGALRGLLWFVLIALLSGFASNLLTSLILDVLPGAERHKDSWWGWTLALVLASIGMLIGSTYRLYKLRNAIFTHSIQPENDSVSKPRRVLITALSNDGRHAEADPLRGDLLLEWLHRNPQLGLGVFGLNTAKFEAEIKALGVTLEPWAARLPWLTNFVAIAAHSARLDTVVVVPSHDGPNKGGSDHRFPAFEQAVRLLWARGPSAARPLRVIKAGPRNYDDYETLLRGIEEAAGLSGVPEDSEVCIDVTSGTKPVSIAGAITTMNRDHTFMYVTNQRHFVVFDARLSLGSGF